MQNNKTAVDFDYRQSQIKNIGTLDYSVEEFTLK